jgi:hypothetical protein
MVSPQDESRVEIFWSLPDGMRKGPFRLPRIGKDRKRKKIDFPKLGKLQNEKKEGSQGWERPKTRKRKFPKVGKD